MINTYIRGESMIKFTKMQGLGNDYVYIDCTEMEEEQIENISSLAKIMSDRHFGIGSDGLILICKSKTEDFKMRMFNSDGTEAEMCGNGIRCVGKFVHDKGLTKKEELTIETLARNEAFKITYKRRKSGHSYSRYGKAYIDSWRNSCYFRRKSRKEFRTYSIG